jgi:hydrogenase maturation protease HycI
VLGVGHELRGDDAVGLAVAERLQARHAPNWLVLAGGSAPENVTGILRRFHPDLVILVDAAELHARPGTIEWLDCSRIDGVSASTHTLPLSALGAFVGAETGATLGVLAVQPATDEVGTPLSPELDRAARRVVRALSALMS